MDPRPIPTKRAFIKRVIIVVVVILVAVSIPTFLHVQRNTDLGIFLLGGGTYRIEQARITSDPVDAKHHLQRVLDATQYGVNTAQNAVYALPDPRDRARLFGYLVELAPNDNWRKLYSLDLEKQIAQFEPSHSVIE